MGVLRAPCCSEISEVLIVFSWAFTLYQVDYRSASKTILDGTIFVKIMSWNTSVPKLIRSVSDSFLERSLLM